MSVRPSRSTDDPVGQAAPPEAGIDAAVLLAELDAALAVAVHGRRSFSEARSRAALYTVLTRVSNRLETLAPGGGPDALGLQLLLTELGANTPLRALRLDTVAWICQARASLLDDLLRLDDDA
jgi:hypothetical protein